MLRLYTDVFVQMRVYVYAGVLAHFLRTLYV
jgi:hypothetical protein